MSTNQRLRGRALQRMREAKRAENPLCVDCYAKGIVRAWDELDHEVPIEKGGTDDWENLIGRCWSCHRSKTAKDRGYRVNGACDANGMPLDPNHPWGATGSAVGGQDGKQ